MENTGLFKKFNDLDDRSLFIELAFEKYNYEMDVQNILENIALKRGLIKGNIDAFKLNLFKIFNAKIECKNCSAELILESDDLMKCRLICPDCEAKQNFEYNEPKYFNVNIDEKDSPIIEYETLKEILITDEYTLISDSIQAIQRYKTAILHGSIAGIVGALLILFSYIGGRFGFIKGLIAEMAGFWIFPYISILCVLSYLLYRSQKFAAIFLFFIYFTQTFILLPNKEYLATLIHMIILVFLGRAIWGIIILDKIPPPELDKVSQK